MLTLKLQAKDYELTLLPAPHKVKQSQDQSLFQAEHFRPCLGVEGCYNKVGNGGNGGKGEQAGSELKSLYYAILFDIKYNCPILSYTALFCTVFFSIIQTAILPSSAQAPAKLG